MTGKKINSYFADFYHRQLKFQKKICNNIGYGLAETSDLPDDNVEIAKYHLLALSEEVGELIKSDKRWKNYRNTHYDKENKLEEISDCFITLFNIAIFSGISADELEIALDKKMSENNDRLQEENGGS